MKRGLVVLVLVAVAAFYVLEQYVLVGKVLVNATANISEMNPRPGLTIPVQEEGTEVRVYMKADDLEVTYTLLSPAEEVLAEETLSLGRDSFTFDAPQRGSYLLLLRSDEGQEGQVTLSAWANDNRLFYSLYF